MLGPLQVKLNRNTLRKAQVIILTCTSSRAIHLELVTYKSSDEFVDGISSFCLLAIQMFAGLTVGKLSWWTGVFERDNAQLGLPQDSEHSFRKKKLPVISLGDGISPLHLIKTESSSH